VPVKTVVLAWELGGGMGHVMMLARLAARLRQPDLRLVAVIKAPEAAAVLAARGIEVLAAPRWPSAAIPPEQIAGTSSATMGDILATAGLADAEGLRQLLRAWDEILLRLKPDLVVANLAPAAAIVARGRFPLMQVGDGFTLPPDGVTRFPPLHTMSDPHDEAVPLAVLNGVLRSRGEPPFDYLPRIFAGEARMVFTFPLLDPYAAQRSEPLHGPLADTSPVASDPDSGAIFAYLSRGYRLHREIPDALLAHARRLRIHAPELSDDQLSALSKAGAMIEREPVAPAPVLASSSLVIHLGGSSLAAEALMAGVPQLVLSMQVEQWLTGAALQRGGVGRLVAAYDAESRIAPEIDAMYEDPAFARRANEAGRQHREFFRRADALAVFAHTSRRLLGL
jgi:UDP:flavonoid glycosyltransferase YjiC (YdhE family)